MSNAKIIDVLYIIDTKTMSNYPIIDALIGKQQEFDAVLASYSTNYDNYLNSAVTPAPDSALASTMKSEVASMASIMTEMDGLLETAFDQGLVNQDHSAQASAALADQSILVERRMKQFEDARDRLAHLAGEEQVTMMDVRKSRFRYYIYFIFAVALVVSITYMVMGGSLPMGLLLILLVLGVFITWEFYKSWLGSIGNMAVGGPSQVKGVFRLMT